MPLEFTHGNECLADIIDVRTPSVLLMLTHLYHVKYPYMFDQIERSAAFVPLALFILFLFCLCIICVAIFNSKQLDYWIHFFLAGRAPLFLQMRGRWATRYCYLVCVCFE